MPDIMVVLACLSQCVQPTTLRYLERVIEAMLSISGRMTMKGLSRWSGKGGSYRTIQRLFNTGLNGCQLNWRWYWILPVVCISTTGDSMFGVRRTHLVDERGKFELAQIP